MINFTASKQLIIAVIFVVFLGGLVFFRDKISNLLDFGLDSDKNISVVLPDMTSSTPPAIVPRETSLIEIKPITIKEEKLPMRYAGRDPEEIRPVPEEIKLFTEEQKSQIYSSIKSYAEKVKQRPEILEDWLQIGILKKIIGDFEGARDSWEYAGVVSPLNSVSFANLGELYWRYLHEYPKSEKNFLISIKHKPDDTQTYISLSGLYFYSYKEKENLADDVLFDGLKANPGDTNLMKALASLYEKQKDYSKSLEWWEKVLKNEPDNKDVAKTIEDVRKKIDGLTY